MHTTGNIIYWIGLAAILANLAPLFTTRRDPLDTIRRALGSVALSCLLLVLSAILLHKYFAMAIALALAIVFAVSWRHYRNLQRNQD